MSKTEMRKVVLAYPYDGAFVWFINKDFMHSEETEGRYTGSHPYYRALYGPKHHLLAGKTASLSIFYDEVIIAQADIGLPDSNSYRKGRSYFNPLIGLYHNWDDYSDNSAMIDQLTEEDLHDPIIKQWIPQGNGWFKKLIMQRVNLQIYLAKHHNARILAGPEFQKIFDHKLKMAQMPLTVSMEAATETDKVKVIDKYFGVSCLELKMLRYDDLVLLRDDELVQQYAADFHAALDKAYVSPRPEEEFKLAIRRSITRKEMALKTKNKFSLGGRITTYAGLIPILGNIASGAGVATDIGAAAAETVEKKSSWYLLGPRISEVLLTDKFKSDKQLE